MAIKSLLFSCVCLSGTLLFSESWEKTDLIWGLGVASSCDVGCVKEPRQYFVNEPYVNIDLYKDIRQGDLVWVHPTFLNEFYEKIGVKSLVSYILVITGGDETFPNDCISSEVYREILHDTRVHHVFAQNCSLPEENTKVTRIPIGIDFHTVAYKGSNGGWGMKGSPLKQQSILLEYLSEALPTDQRKCRAFVDFQHSDTLRAGFKRYLEWGEDRRSIFQTIMLSGVVDHGSWMSRQNLWKKKSEYAFSISPHGNGLDCHRTWEDLALGCILIVKTSSLDPIYEGLPVEIINDWSEITEENFCKWLNKWGDVTMNSKYRQKLTHKYWMDQIMEKANQILP